MSDLDSISIKPETLGGILKAGGRLIVPVNQRSYRWEQDHVEDLFKDIALALDEERSEYFLGSVVVVAKADGTKEVNDGQQRLATTMVLISAIRDYLAENNFAKLADQVERHYLMEEDRKSQEMVYKLRLNTEDHQFFGEKIIARGATPRPATQKPDTLRKESHVRLEEAKRLAVERVQSIVTGAGSPDAAKNRLVKWLDFLDESARVIWVEVSKESTAYIIFETLNDRGLKLSSADLLKNYIYGLSGNRLQEAIQKWQSMKGTLEALGDGESGIVEYVRYLWMAKYGHIRTPALYDAIKTKISKKQDALDWVSELEDRANHYAAILSSSHDFWNPYGPEVRKQITTISVLGVTQIRPILLAAIKTFPKAEFSKLLDACICWSVRFLISGFPSGTLEGHYAKAALRITKSEILTVAKLTKELLEILPSDEKFQAAFETVNVSKSSLSRYYLRSLQLALDGEKEPQYVPNDGAAITVEHILPENPRPADWGHISADEAKSDWRRLGNQALLQAGPNSAIGNMKFEDKKAAYALSAFSLTKDLFGLSVWDGKAIRARQKAMAVTAIKTWPIARPQ